MSSPEEVADSKPEEEEITEKELQEDLRKKDKTYVYHDEQTGKTKTVRRKWTNKTDRELRNSQLLQFLEDNHEFLSKNPSYAQIAQEFNKKVNYENPVSVSAVYKSAAKYCESHDIQRKKKVRKSE